MKRKINNMIKSLREFFALIGIGFIIWFNVIRLLIIMIKNEIANFIYERKMKKYHEKRKN